MSCLERHDLAVAKLQAGSPKDLALLAALLATGRLHFDTIRQRINETILNDKTVVFVFEKLRETIEIARK